MLGPGAQALAIGAGLSAIAAVAHLECIVIGAPAYRFMGAGERMARAAEAAKMQPTLVTLAIAGVLLVWSGYALSGAGIIDRLPFTKLVLLAICSVYIARAVAFPMLKAVFPGNSETFWLVSSGICLFIGLVILWTRLALARAVMPNASSQSEV
jgi:hypothetical protein